MWYKITIKDNVITIRNFSSQDIVRATVFVSSQCGDEYKQVIDPFEIDYQEDRKFPLIDGIYKIKIERIYNNVVIEEEDVIHPYYGMFIQSIIDETEKILCGCGCSDCDDCLKNEKDTLSLVLKSFSYYTLLYPYYNRFYNAIFSCLRCNIADINNCVIINERFVGNAETEDLIKKILSSFYLSFYFAEYYAVEDKSIIDKKFKFDKISKCIKATNTDIECIKNNIENTMGTFSITSTGYVNQAPSTVGNIAMEVNNRATTTLTAAMFTTGTTPAYSDPENDPAQAIRIDSLPTQGNLTFDDSPVTVGQIITIADINLNKLKYISPNQNEIASNDLFNFSVRDTGSMQFTS